MSLSDKKTVAVAISGGLDSGVCAYLLKKQGFNVVGVTGIMHSNESTNSIVYKAQKIAELLDIEHHVLNLCEQFKTNVIDYFDESYKKALTPNPCIKCNKHIKWGAIFDWAINERKADFYATGHYAKIKNIDGKFLLYPSAGGLKDQIYYLFELSQEQLRKTIFPLNEYTKAEIKEIGERLGLINKDTYKESQDICFIEKNSSVQRYLCEKYGRTEGDFVDINTGKCLGIHKGYFNYTIGQRKGIGIAHTEPLYVVDTDATKNIVYLGVKSNLFKDELFVPNCVFSDYENQNEFEANVKIRNNMFPRNAKITKSGEGVLIKFDEPVSAITKGQAAVFYDVVDGHLIGGGWIL